MSCKVVVNCRLLYFKKIILSIAEKMGKKDKKIKKKGAEKTAEKTEKKLKQKQKKDLAEKG